MMTLPKMTEIPAIGMTVEVFDTWVHEGATKIVGYFKQEHIPTYFFFARGKVTVAQFVGNFERPEERDEFRRWAKEFAAKHRLLAVAFVAELYIKTIKDDDDLLPYLSGDLRARDAIDRKEMLRVLVQTPQQIVSTMYEIRRNAGNIMSLSKLVPEVLGESPFMEFFT